MKECIVGNEKFRIMVLSVRVWFVNDSLKEDRGEFYVELFGG